MDQFGGLVTSLPREDLPELIGELERIKAAAWSALMAPQNGNGRGPEGDRLLDAGQAAQKLGISKDALYRHNYPFSLRIGGKRRFSQLGIERYIKQRAGRD